ncbi:MAG: hypothetical protein A2785_03350 [Candidatus Chisholmbacteria bacterium RIFCSPHIGHO2_01_FULL_49_18]|uniref:Uncharacterized protein n=1 Tax=Candidatus Chisholmbacteria bacterium RIFCSPHIGHO2_01_FULL_49_18 TaxID=1797590 RepID=A0A1G1VMM4_9BACT|nr:MAG: hypothetical protein A2785_03350 [Candidatus Chisholmbacteria bacterium RIFCSPHIGHO2_01_FULL_49_18]
MATTLGNKERSETRRRSDFVPPLLDGFNPSVSVGRTTRGSPQILRLRSGQVLPNEMSPNPRTRVNTVQGSPFLVFPSEIELAGSPSHGDHALF